jgi:hypothetical protein
MEETEDKPRGFKVEDRRRFSTEGELKPDQGGSSDEVAAPSATAREEPARASQPMPSSAPADASPLASDAEAPDEPTFAAFIVSLYTQAMILLGEIPDPATREPVHDLPAAQQIIDIIGMLQEKTSGNLDKDEAGLLESTLYDLRMKFVEASRPQVR